MRAARQRPMPEEGLHQAFARIARTRPDALALTGPEGPVGYGRLDRTADAWAARLSDAGVRQGDVVPILLPRGTALVTALLAVLKTGAAYALLEPAWPERRLREIVDRTHAPLLIGTAAQAALGTVWTPPEDSLPAHDDFRPVAVSSDAPCCLFFTSGTTGRPKGVLSPHRATARLFPPDGAGGFVDLGPGSVVTVAAPVPWDAFSLELWGALLTGATALLVDEPYLSPQALRRAVATHRADTAWLTAGLFNMVVDEDPDAFTGLRRLMIGGERLSPGHVGRFLRRHHDIELLNGYGPVESTVFATTHRITEADCARPDGIPLGTPVPGTQVHVLDGEHPCRTGETGEICLAGEGLALRYLGDPALTRAAFPTLRLPEGDGPTRIYRTGDLGHLDADGVLHYRGRADRQIKIRGHRVEPAEVERQIEEMLPVRNCRVLPRRDVHGAVHDLTAFCVPRTAGDPLDGARELLAGALVPYHRPSAVVSVPAFPLTPAGKLDERALLALPVSGELEVQETGPATPPAPAEAGGVALVTEVFAEVLGRSPVPPRVSFFELGGGSLDAGRVCARLSARLHRPVPVSHLYQEPTAAGLAPLLQTPPRQPAGPEADPTRVPLTPLQLVHLTRHLTGQDDRTGECRMSWIVEGEPDQEALESAIAWTHARHQALQARYVVDPAPAAVLPGQPSPALETLPPQPTVDAAFKALDEQFSDGLEPADGEVWRTALVPVADGASRAVLGCLVHHLAFDGWSEAVLARDLSTGCRRALGLPTGPVPDVPTLAQAYAGHVQRVAHTDQDAQRARLRRELAGAPDLRWPAGPRSPGPVRHRELRLPPGDVAALDAEAATAGSTRFAAVLRHFGRALAEATGQRDYTVGVPVSQRDSVLTEQAVGCHLTMVPLRLRGAVLDDGPEAIRAAARRVADALAAQDVPFGDLLEIAGRSPGGHRPPLYQVLFALQDNAPAHLELPGCSARFVRSPYAELPLELHAELWPEADGGLKLSVSYRPDVVPGTVVDAFLEHFATHSGGVS